MLRSNDYDVVVVGAGPSGANCARFAAAAGLRVLLIDKKAELGVPTECSGAVSARALVDSGVPIADEFIVTAIAGFLTYSNEGTPWRIDYRELAGRQTIGYVVDRRRLDTFVAGLAADAGAELALRTELEGVSRVDPAHVETGWTLRGRHLGLPFAIHTQVLVAADGVGSRIAKWVRVNSTLPLHEAASCIQYEMTNVATDRLLELVVGQDHAPGGYVWIFPTAPGRAKVGLGVVKTMTRQPPGWYLERFIESSFMHDRFKQARILEVSIGTVPLARPLLTPYADGVLFIGDAGRHVNSLTGGGIHTALQSGRIAGESLAALWAAGDYSKQGLAAWGCAYEQQMGAGLRAVYELKTAVFCVTDPVAQNAQLFELLGGYFRPDSAHRKR
ncbi:MAG TPA: NAD(P)/FAD-dependent oxidoreductase [Chloroflexia bacterium]|nr:NAD(P)/FAD-dependent oxidoreductase [Chloroflexia bacterium]